MNKYKATIGICGNVLIIVLMAKKRLNSAVDILVINLAAADCLYCLGLPIWAYEMMQKFTYNIPSGPKILKSLLPSLSLRVSKYFLDLVPLKKQTLKDLGKMMNL